MHGRRSIQDILELHSKRIDVEEGVTIDLDEKRHIIGIEILDVSKKLSLKDIVNITIENLPIEKVETATV
jgi:uncharacterized protein YuzE